MDKLTKCFACHDLLCEPVSTICGHNFCRECIRQDLLFQDHHRTCLECQKKLPAQLNTNRLLESLLAAAFPKQYARRLQRKGRRQPLSSRRVFLHAATSTARTIWWVSIGCLAALLAIERVEVIPKTVLRVSKLVLKGQYYPTSLVWQVVWGIAHVVFRYIESTGMLSGITF